MYVFYQHHRSADGALLLSELKLSSYDDHWTIAFPSKIRRMSPAYLQMSQVEVACFELAKPVLKFPPISKRSYDENTKIWTYFDNYGAQVLQKLEEVLRAIKPITGIEVEDLQFLATRQHFDVGVTRKRAMKPEDFFYQPAAGGSNVLTKENVTAKLAALLEVSSENLASAQSAELKKLYRRAALRLHPDRNNGDGSRMSELNMLWSVYNG